MDWLQDTKRRLAKAPRWLTLSRIARETNLQLSWLSAFAASKIPEPGVRKVQILHDYLCAAPKREPVTYTFKPLPPIFSDFEDDEDPCTYLCAVYEIWAQDKCLYVGQSKNIAQRISAHSQNKELMKLNPTHIVIHEYVNSELPYMDVSGALLAYEKIKIKELCPALNQKHKQLNV